MSSISLACTSNNFSCAFAAGCETPGGGALQPRWRVRFRAETHALHPQRCRRAWCCACSVSRCTSSSLNLYARCRISGRKRSARARKSRRAYAPRAHCKISGDAFSLIHARRSSAMSLSCAPPAPADGASSYAASPMRTKRQAQAAPRCTPTVARGLPRVACALASRRLERWSAGGGCVERCGSSPSLYLEEHQPSWRLIGTWAALEEPARRGAALLTFALAGGGASRRRCVARAPCCVGPAQAARQRLACLRKALHPSREHRTPPCRAAPAPPCAAAQLHARALTRLRVHRCARRHGSQVRARCARRDACSPRVGAARAGPSGGRARRTRAAAPGGGAAERCRHSRGALRARGVPAACRLLRHCCHPWPLQTSCSAARLLTAPPAACRTETCRFSGLRIYPGRGIKLARTDGQASPAHQRAGRRAARAARQLLAPSRAHCARLPHALCARAAV
jgi:hypothetical protein